MRRGITAVGVAVAAAVAISGCGAAPPSNELRFYHNKNEWGPFYDEVAAEGLAATGIDLVSTNIPQNDNYVALIRSSTMTRQKPDIFSWAVGADLATLVQYDALLDVTDIWDEAIARGDIAEGLRDVFTIDDRQWGIPGTSSYWVMFYNLEIFEQLGLEPPTTWEEMEAAAEVVLDSGVTPFQQPGGVFAFVWFQTLLGANYPEVYEGLIDGTVPFTDPRVVEVMEQWKDMIDRGWMSDSLSSTSPTTQFANGQVAMMPGGTFYAGDLAVNGADKDDWGIFTVPARNPDIDTPVLFFEVGPIVASAGLPHEQEIRDYLQWWTGPEAQQIWADNLGDTSANPKVELPDPEYTELVRSLDGYVLLQRYYESVPPRVLTATLDGLQTFMISPDQYPIILERIETVNAAVRAGMSEEARR